MNYRISVEKTAINTGVSYSAKLLKKELIKNSKVLDFGYGKGRNSVFLKDEFILDGLDTEKQIESTKKNIKNIFKNIFNESEKLNGKYDGVLLAYVLNVIPSVEERRNVLKKAYNTLSWKGKLYIQVRSDKSLNKIKHKKIYKDGLIVGKSKTKTFQKGFTRKDLKQLLVSESIYNFKIIKKGSNFIAIVNKENFGQMSLRKISQNADYLQLDICGLNKKEALKRYEAYNQSIPVMIHGDWTKKGASENNLDYRHKEYTNIINSLSEKTDVVGITIHPPTKASMDEFELISILEKIYKDTDVPVLLENRSNNKYIVSTPKEVINFSKKHFMTIDVPQLYIACKFNEELFIDTLSKINWQNIKELHIGGLVRKLKSNGAKRNMTLVAQQLTKGILNYKKYNKYFKGVPFKTFEILGSHNTFNEQLEIFKSWACESYE